MTDAQGAQRLPPGRRVGPYELTRLLGEGAMGSVYQARDLRVGRDVALKLPQISGNDLGHVARLHREGQATAALSHPNVVRIHDLGEIQGVPYLAYELVSGARPLDEAAEGASMRRRVELLRDAARGVGHAHARGVLHRDLKPENVLVDGAGQVKVADFGLARIVGLEALTRTGAMLGTPRTMSPEQIEGRGEDYGPPTDVWALGVTLYRLLTDDYPFRGHTLINLMAAITTHDAPSPSGLVPGLAPELDAVCRRALQKEPAQRFADGDAFADALDACLELPELVGAPPASQRLPLALGAAAVVLLGLVVALLVARSQRGEGDAPPPPERPAVSELDPKWVRAGKRDLRGWRRERDHEQRIAEAERWLVEYAGHPDAPEVRDLLEESRLEVPLWTETIPSTAHWAGWVGDRVLTCENDNARLWSDGDVVRKWRLGIAHQHVSAAPGGESVVICETTKGDQGRLVWLNPNRDAVLYSGSPPELTSGVSALAHHPSEPVVAIGLDGAVCLLELGSEPKVARTLDAGRREDAPVEALAWSPDGAKLLIGRGHTGPVPMRDVTGFQLWDVARDAPIGPHHNTGSRAKAARWRPGSDQVAASTSDGEVLLFNGDGTLRHDFQGRGVEQRTDKPKIMAHTSSVSSLAFSPDGAILVSAGQRSGAQLAELRVWNPEAAQELERAGFPAVFRLDRPPLRSVELHPKGGKLLVAAVHACEVWTFPTR